MTKSKELFVEFMSTYSRIESQINSIIESFLVPSGNNDKSSEIRSLVLNRALHKSEIFYAFESKIKFVSLINEYVNSESKKYALDYDESRWKQVRKELKVVQEVRNKLAHEWLNFGAEEGYISFYKGTTGKTQLLKYDMEEEVRKAQEVLSVLRNYNLDITKNFRLLFNKVNE